MVLVEHNVKVLGSGGQVVVLAPGFGTDQSCFRYVVPSLLQKNLRVILYDIMGAGSTNADDFSFKRYSSLHAHAGDLLAILDELEIRSCVYLNDVQSKKDAAVPVQVAEYLGKHLGGSLSVEILQTEGHLPQLSAPELVVPVLLRCIDH